MKIGIAVPDQDNDPSRLIAGLQWPMMGASLPL